MNNIKSILFSTASYMGAFISKMFRVVDKNKPSDINMNEVLFYGADDKEQSRQVGLNNLLCVSFVVLHATRTVDVCMPNLVSETIAECLTSVKRRNNVKIRVSVYNTDDFHNLQSIAENGIEVRVLNSAVTLEHEFILIDASESCEDAVAMIGSLNYETNRVNCNRDATVLTSDFTVVNTLKREFDRVWCSSAVITFENLNKHYGQGLDEKK